ncbi:MAG: hypothetical protein H0U95_11245 [Bacteroidetes bacterium]|nr:hypothetical protein [Bacteroidota bacterium]
MNKLFVLLGLSALFFVSCAKDPIPVVGEPIKVVDNVYAYRLDSLKHIDTAIIKVNGVKLKDSIYNHNILLNKGDILSFYFSGDASTGTIDPYNRFNFAVWKNDNNLPAQSTIKYFSNNLKPIYYLYYYLLPGATNYSSVTYYNFRHSLSGQFVAQ